MEAVGLILSQFPCTDEAFLLREVSLLAEECRELTIFSLRPCGDRVIHEQARLLQRRTLYAPFFWSRALWASHLYFLRVNPRAYAGALGWIFRRHLANPVILAKTLLLFPKMVHFARLSLDRGIQHLHAFWATYPATAAVVTQRLTGIRYSLSGHAHDIYRANPTLAEKIRKARFVLTCTEANRRYLASLANGNRDSVLLSYHGVDLARFAAVDKSPHQALRILSVGSLLPCKGFETLIAACALLKKSYVAFHCVIAGGGPLFARLKGFAARLGLQAQVELTGPVSQEDLVKFYQEADLFVLPLDPKIHWGIPNVLIEALATKTPVVTCGLPSLTELIQHGVSGWVIPEKDPRALAQAAKYLWANEPLRRRMAETGCQRVRERFDLRVTGEQFKELFR